MSNLFTFLYRPDTLSVVPNGSSSLKHKPLDDGEIQRLCKRITKIEVKRDTAQIRGHFDKFHARPLISELQQVSGLDSNGHTIFVADAHRGDGKRFVVRTDQKLTAFLELEAVTRSCSELS